MPSTVLIRGGGDLASGVAVRLTRAGINILIIELPQPLVVRRLVSFAQAVYIGSCQVEEVNGKLVTDGEQAQAVLKDGDVPVLVDPQAHIINTLNPDILIDARMRKQPPEIGMEAAALVVGLGPGFIAGENCQAVIETKRGHSLGRVIWEGVPEANTGIPGSILKHNADRIIRAPADGELIAHVQICELLKRGDVIAEVAEETVTAPFDGVLRGLVYPGINVQAGLKIGDLDPRGDPAYCTRVSDKALAIGGGVLEAILSKPDIRKRLWD